MEITNNYLHEMILLDPTINDIINQKEYIQYRDILPNYFLDSYDNKILKLSKKYINILKQKKNKNIYDQLLEIDLNEYLKTLYFDDRYLPLSHLDNIYSNFIMEINSKDSKYSFKDLQSYKDYIHRLKNLKDISKTIILFLKKGIKNNITIPYRIVKSIIKQNQELLKNNTYQNEFNHYQKIPSSIKKEFLNSIQSCLIQSIMDINKFLINQYTDKCRKTIGLSYIKNGKKYYKDIISFYTSDKYTPETIHKLGYTEINKNLKNLSDLKRKMKINTDYQSFINEMKNKHNLNKKDNKYILNELEKIKKRSKKIFTKYFHGSLSDKDFYKIKIVPEEEDHSFAYYVCPEINTNKNGIFYINPNNINKYELPVLSLHEGIPGHHYEYKYNYKKKKPLYYKLSNYTSYSEGWGLYCESLLESNNNFELFWKYIYNLHRSIRLVIDTGIHYYNWSFDKCFYFMKQYLPLSDEQIQNEIYRYISDPGQAITYKIGELFILDLRKKYFKKYGENYKDFHKFFLDIGPCPLNIVEEKFNELFKMIED